MIKISLTRDEIEDAIIAFAKDKILSYGILDENDIKVSQGKSATATILIVPKKATEAEAAEAISEAEKEIETVAGQPDVVETYREPSAAVTGFASN